LHLLRRRELRRQRGEHADRRGGTDDGAGAAQEFAPVDEPVHIAIEEPEHLGWKSAVVSRFAIVVSRSCPR
jgi:hypothetical protein